MSQLTLTELSLSSREVCEDAVRKANLQARGLLDDVLGPLLSTISGESLITLRQSWNPFATVQASHGYVISLQVETDPLAHKALADPEIYEVFHQIAMDAYEDTFVDNPAFIKSLLEELFND